MKRPILSIRTDARMSLAEQLVQLKAQQEGRGGIPHANADDQGHRRPTCKKLSGQNGSPRAREAS